ncbi:MAG: MFS transporter [Puniceicoccales bacterium]|jgi:MFS family permease|nr:MFS transporter [Puniceicoccales bacterium]
MQQQNKIALDTPNVTLKSIPDKIMTRQDDALSNRQSACVSTKVAQKTFFFDCLRYLCQGALDEEWRTMILVMAIRIFDMPLISKALLTSIGFIGMIFTPLTQAWAHRSRWNAMEVSALYFIFIAIAFFCAAFSTSWIPFFTFMALGKIFDKQQIPLMIGVYSTNYPRPYRGYKVGTAMACMPLGGIIFTQCVGIFLNKTPNHFIYILSIASLLSLLCAFCFLKIPVQNVEPSFHLSLRDNFKFIAKDRIFIAILFLYSLIAVANQMTLPLRVEYLANHKHGIDASLGTLIGLFAILQPLACILSGPIWGKLYDRIHFITMRQWVTLCFLIGIPLFFATHELSVISLASILLGIGRSGGMVFWSLWVTDIVPSRRVSAYMSANTAVMGLRDALAPALGYALLHYTSPWTVGVVAFALLVISLLGFEYLCRHSAYEKRMADMERDGAFNKN